MEGSRSRRAGWWDVYPLLERPRRPLQWSQSSVIFTAHPVQPIITGHHFSSSKQFILPSPQPIIASPAAFDPATVISVASGDEWLVAYFPRRDGEGIACLWKRGPHIDNWQVKECWSFPKGGGIVTASWIGKRREWVAGPADIPERLPCRGPPVPVSDTTLLLITQDHSVQLAFIRHYSSGLKIIKRSLMVPGQTWENTPTVDHSDISHTRQCVEAAIGIGYNEKSIFVATHSRRLPPPIPTTMNTSAFNTMDLSVSSELTSLDHKSVEWENWGEERTVELFEVHIRFDGFQLGLALNQITTLECQPFFLSGLTFICTPPPNSVPPADVTLSPAQQKPNPQDRGRIGLLTSYIDFHDYANPATSILTLHSIAIRLVSNRPVWTAYQTATRMTESGIISHLEPFVDFSGSSTVLLYASFLDTSTLSSAIQSKSPAAEVPVGNLKVLTIPNLNDHPQWGSTAIQMPTDNFGVNLPLFACLSPNRRLFCTLSSCLWKNKTAVYPLPLPGGLEMSSSRLPLALAIAILGRQSTADLIHTLCSPQVPTSDAANVLRQTLGILHKYNDDSSNDYSWEILGLATEIYRAKSLLSRNEEEAEMLKSRWEAARDICLLAACNLAFESCKESDNYDLEAAWQMIEICLWVLSFTKRLMKACVLSSSAAVALEDGDLLELDTMAIPILLTICHPFSFHSLFVALRHVKDYRSFLGSLPAGSENSQVAKSILVDAVDCSGVDFGALISLLEEHYLDSIQKLDPEECRNALAVCHPTGMMRPHLGRLLQRISENEGVLNKPILFITPNDLVDGLVNLSIGTQPSAHEQDIITKGALAKQGYRGVCLRCGGKTAMNRDVTVPRGRTHSKWHLFELMWQLRCVCGGTWFSLDR